LRAKVDLLIHFDADFSDNESIDITSKEKQDDCLLKLVTINHLSYTYPCKFIYL